MNTMEEALVDQIQTTGAESEDEVSRFSDRMRKALEASQNVRAMTSELIEERSAVQSEAARKIKEIDAALAQLGYQNRALIGKSVTGTNAGTGNPAPRRPGRPPGSKNKKK